MNRRKIIFIALALLLGLSLIFVMRASSGSKQPKVASGMEVLVAASDLPSGRFIQAQDLRWQSWAPNHVTEAFIRKKGRNDKEMIGAVVRKGIRSGEPILRGKVVKPRDRGFLSAVLEPGKRAVAAPITNVTGIAGFVFPGDRVDLILTHTIRSAQNSQRRASVTILRDVRVLALDQNTNDQKTKQPKPAKVVTLEVDPEQAEIVTLALRLGTLSLSLRSLAEPGNGKALAAPVGFRAGHYTMDSDISGLIPAPRAHRDENSESVRVLRGRHHSETSFRDPAFPSSQKDMIDETRDAAR